MGRRNKETVTTYIMNVAVSTEDALARHRKEYPKLHDKLGPIYGMLTARW